MILTRFSQEKTAAFIWFSQEFVSGAPIKEDKQVPIEKTVTDAPFSLSLPSSSMLNQSWTYLLRTKRISKWSIG
jgi:hypothetical protein